MADILDSMCMECMNCKTQSPNLKRCKGCHWICYCSVDCQKADWLQHKTLCERLNESARDELYRAHRDWEARCPYGKTGLPLGVIPPTGANSVTMAGREKIYLKNIPKYKR